MNRWRILFGVAVKRAMQNNMSNPHHFRWKKDDGIGRMYDVRVAMIQRTGMRTRRIERGISAC